MVRITKVYTKTGDKGSTQLAGGARVAKTSLRIMAIGNVDELNAAIGFAAQTLLDQSEFAVLLLHIKRIQNELFNLGSQLSVLIEKRHEDTPVILQADTERLEAEIDEMNVQLPTLTSFILPGGGEAATRLHLARTVCRRAEISVVNLGDNEALDGVEVPYLNRLSDWLFVAGRFVADKLGEPELLWQP